MTAANDASIDDLLEAVQTFKAIKETVAKHEALFARLGDKLDGLEQRIAAVEKAASA